MHKRNSHCSYCGARFDAAQPWPRRCCACGNTTYLNPLPVVVVLAPVADGLVTIRRNTEPQRGWLTLPGGYLDLGETWQQGGRRELQEETGIDIGEGKLRLYDVQNGLDGTLVIFGLAEKLPIDVLVPFSSEETQEVVLIKAPRQLGFSMHTAVVARYFSEQARHGSEGCDS